MNQELSAIIETVGRVVGEDLSLYDAAFLARSLDKRLIVTGTTHTLAYLDYLIGHPAEAEAFYRSLNITYSEFFRNPLAFALLEQLIVPGLCEAKEAAGTAELRAWSAGCAAGQEAYSLGMLLEDAIATRGNRIMFRIFATDRSEAGLMTARQGAYDAATMQNVRLRHLRDYFTQQGDTYIVASRLRNRLDFSTYDLFDQRSVSPPASIFGGFDLVLCSNLLIYYRADIQDGIMNKLRRALAPHGYLVTGEAERGIVERINGFRAVAPPATVFQKTGSGR